MLPPQYSSSNPTLALHPSSQVLGRYTLPPGIRPADLMPSQHLMPSQLGHDHEAWDSYYESELETEFLDPSSETEWRVANGQKVCLN